jgi:SAM-dependent methyltransferase
MNLDNSNTWSVGRSCPTSLELVRALPRDATVADVGCYGWLLGEAALSSAADYVGVDRVEPPGRPAHARFALASNATIELPDDSCDLVVASHVLEHVATPVELAAELLRIAKPGGRVWIESPSELGCQTIGSMDVEDQHFYSFWDDPTHVRPWTPGALYRLALTCQAIPIAIQRGQTGDVPVCTMLALKPRNLRGKPATRFVTLKNVLPGLRAAYESVWPAVEKPSRHRAGSESFELRRRAVPGISR